MSALICRLQAEHAAMLDIIGRIRASGFDHAACWAELEVIRGTMLAHLLVEDRHLYPALMRASTTHPILADMVHRYQQDLDTVAGAAFVFFRDHGGRPRSDRFAADLASLCDRIEQRIRKEEQLLYPTYEKLVQSGDVIEAEPTAA